MRRGACGWPLLPPALLIGVASTLGRLGFEPPLRCALASDPSARSVEYTRAFGRRDPSSEDSALRPSFSECLVCCGFWNRPGLLRPCLLLEALPRIPDSRLLLCCASSDSGAPELLLNWPRLRTQRTEQEQRERADTRPFLGELLGLATAASP